MKNYLKALSGLLILSASTLANAHPGHGIESVYAGLIHPLTGWDHLLVMIAVGLLSGKLGGNAKWQLPLTFLTLMALGCVFTQFVIPFSGLETSLAASLMAMGLLLLISFPIHTLLRTALVGTFAFLHGMAHGAEIPIQQSGRILAAMLFTTALLHMLGLFLSSDFFKARKTIIFMFGCLMMFLGGYSLIS